MNDLSQYKTILGISASVSLLLSSSCLMANSCSKADIDYYLQRGFSHEQVIRLCADSMGSNSTTQSPSATQEYGGGTTIPASSSPAFNRSQNYELTADRVYFETVLNAKSANLTPTHLSYTAKECIKYGEENLGGLRDKACVNSHITVNFKGLKVIKAIKGILLIRDQEMVLQGNINREYLNYNSLSPAQQAVIRAKLPTQPNRLDLPVRKGIDPKLVAQKLKKYITQ